MAGHCAQCLSAPCAAMGSTHARLRSLLRGCAPRAQMLGMHGTVAANYAVDRADLLLAFGVRFDDRVTGTPPFCLGPALVLVLPVSLPCAMSTAPRVHAWL